MKQKELPLKLDLDQLREDYEAALAALIKPRPVHIGGWGKEAKAEAGSFVEKYVKALEESQVK